VIGSANIQLLIFLLEPVMMSAFGSGHSSSQMKEKLLLISLAAFSNSTSSSKNDVAAGLAQLTELSSLLDKTTSMAQLQFHFSSVLSSLKYGLENDPF
jgi:hypothetical protein